jgi:tetratricopeptide (TPR) repeat protein
VLFLFIVLWKKELFFQQKNKIFLTSAILLLVMVAYLSFRFTLLANLNSKSLSLIAEQPLSVRLFTLPAVIITYFRLLIAPFHYHMEYHFIVERFFSWQMGMIIILVGLAVYIYYKRLLPRRELLLYYSWFILFLIPVLNLFPLAATLREHWITFSFIGFLLFLGRLLEEYKILNIKILKIPFFKIIWILWIGYIGTYTYVRNTHWRDAFTLYEHDVKYSKDSFILWNNLGVEYFRKDDLKNAEYCFNKSKKVCPPPGYAPTQNNLGVIKQNTGAPEQAIEYYLRAIELDHYELAYQNIGALLAYLNRSNEAITILEQGSLYYPYNYEIQYYLAVAYSQLGNYLKAEMVLSDLLQLYPGESRAVQLLQRVKLRANP